MTAKKKPKTKKVDPKKDFDKPVWKEPGQTLKAAAAKQSRLPGMEDTAIQEIEDAAQEYFELMKVRVAALTREVASGQVLMDIMKKHGKTTYHRGAMHVTTTETKEKVHVKFDKEEE